MTKKTTVEIREFFHVYDLCRHLEKTLEADIAFDDKASLMSKELPGLRERMDELLAACQAYIVEHDYEPTDADLSDCGEPPLSADERHSAAWQQHLEAHS